MIALLSTFFVQVIAGGVDLMIVVVAAIPILSFFLSIPHDSVCAKRL